MKTKIFLKVLSVVLVCIVMFSGVSFFLTREELLGVDVPKTDVPYIDGRYVPADSTVIFRFEDGSGAAVEILFEKKFINILLLSDANEEQAAIFGYHATHFVNFDYTFLMKFVDTLGGINSPDSENYLLTGVQVCNLLAKEKNSPDTAKIIIRGILNKISKNGFSTDLLYCIIENTDTTLSSPACYGWTECLKDCCVSYNIIDGR